MNKILTNGINGNSVSINLLKNNLHLAPKYKWERIAQLIVDYETGKEFDAKELEYALEAASLVQKKLDR